MGEGPGHRSDPQLGSQQDTSARICYSRRLPSEVEPRCSPKRHASALHCSAGTDMPPRGCSSRFLIFQPAPQACHGDWKMSDLQKVEGGESACQMDPSSRPDLTANSRGVETSAAAS